MSHENPFVLPKEQYKRDVNPLRHYVEDQAYHLSLMTDKPLEYCAKYVKKQLRPGGQFEFKDPTVRYLERQSNGDRKEMSSTFSHYLGDSIQKNHLIAPTFTTYVSEEENPSPLVAFIDNNVKMRSLAKKAMYAADKVKDTVMHAIKKIEQQSRKIANNSISGAHVSSSTPLHNKTSHSTLTSNCRTTSGFGNANNEKMLSGNRHYWNPKIVYNNIVSLTNPARTDYEALEAVMTKYNLHYPSVDEVMQAIQYSTDLYWSNSRAMARIRLLVQALTPLARAAFMYTGDLHHLAKHNPEMVRKFITQLSKQVKEPCEDPVPTIHNHREEYLILAIQFFPNQMRGKGLRDVVGQEVEQWIASTVKNIHNTIIEHSDFIKAFFVTRHVPPSLAFLPQSIRRSALASDTDSTIFTVQDWTYWVHGHDAGFDEFTEATEATMIFLAAEAITHILARMSANFGIAAKRIHQVAMKNEFKFDVFVVTQVGKHYYALIGCTEGNLHDTFKMEIKGVHLKNSALPKIITQRAEDMMRFIMERVVAGKKISLGNILKEIADLERKIEKSILDGESLYFRNVQIKQAEVYTKSKEESPYKQYTMWQEVFAPKYGDAPAPPYIAISINVDLKSRLNIKEWIDEVKDAEMKQRLETYFQRTGSKAVTSMALPLQNVMMSGIPTELVEPMKVRNMVFNITKPFYLILETLGWYGVNKKITKMAMDVA